MRPSARQRLKCGQCPRHVRGRPPMPCSKPEIDEKRRID